jgi:hypothetical protein
MTSPGRRAGWPLLGADFWSETVDAFDLDEHDRAVLERAARTRDILVRLDAVTATSPPVVDGPTGPRTHPAIVEHRAQSLALARLLASLRLPDEDDERPQRRGGARGSYDGADGGRGTGQVVRVSRWSRAASR